MTAWKLEKNPYLSPVRGPVVACVMDGVGIGRHDESDAVWLARTPNLDRLAEGAPATRLLAHGKAVGMPSDGDMGNSEVGHNAMGAGRVFDQGAKLVDNAIRERRLFAGEVWKRMLARVGQSGQPLHFIGLLSDGNVHSHIEHLLAMLRACDQEGVRQACVHVLLDGRDVPETSCMQYVEQLEQALSQINRAAGRDYRIASGGGRQTTTMDRYEADWSMVERGWQVHVLGQGRGFRSAAEAIETFRGEQPGVIDQNLPHFVIVDEDGKPVGPIHDGAAVVFYNFRGDRALEISRAFEQDDFTAFERGRRPDVLYAGMMQYDGDLQLPANFLVSPPNIDRTLGEYFARNGLRQLAISETQKFGHVTYFWNGNRTGMFDEKLERYVEIPSDNVPFEQRPWMKAAEITDALIEELRTGAYRHARVNYAGGDMVGHTGDREAAILAVQCVDLQVGRLMRAIEELDGALLVTADHGNADEMYEVDKKTKQIAFDKTTGRPKAKTSHSLNQVPCYLYAPGAKLALDPQIERRGLSNLAGTICQLLGYTPPAEYDRGLLQQG